MSDERSVRQNRSMPAGTVIPVLHYADVPAAAAWLCEAFGFVERLRIGEHRSQLTVGECSVVLTEDLKNVAAEAGRTHSIMIRIAHVDAHYKRARETGANILSEPMTYPFGERQYTAEDVGGHHWTFSETVADVDPAAWGGEIVS